MAATAARPLVATRWLFPRLARGYADAASKPIAKDKSHHVVSYQDDAFPAGFVVAGTHCGIKKKAGALDLGVLVSTADKPCSAAACFTRNVFKAAPVTVSTEILARSKGRASGFVVNSGCANAVTGQKGMENAWAMSRAVDEASPATTSDGTLVLSTGVIGQHVPIDAIKSAIPGLAKSANSSASAWMDLASAFMTTDTFPKLRTRSFQLGGQTIRMAGIDKGAGMIHPNMGPPTALHATLLGVVATDAAITPAALQSALTYAVDRSFNSITVDGDMSTNDTILCLANGAAAGGSGQEIAEGSKEYETFREELRELAEELAQLVVRDGEGATKFVTVNVENAPSRDVAKAVASSVSTSSLFKTAMYGEDANWGRILCAVGYTPLPEGTIDPTRVSVSFLPAEGSSNRSPLVLLTNGEPAEVDEARASEILAEEDFEVRIDLGVQGGEAATYWTCDLSHEYVTINGDYRS